MVDDLLSRDVHLDSSFCYRGLDILQQLILNCDKLCFVSFELDLPDISLLLPLLLFHSGDQVVRDAIDVGELEACFCHESEYSFLTDFRLWSGRRFRQFRLSYRLRDGLSGCIRYSLSARFHHSDCLFRRGYDCVSIF